MRKWLIALCVIFLFVSTFFHSTFCFVAKHLIPHVESFDYDRLMVHRSGVELRGVRMKLKMGKMSVKKIRVPYRGNRTPVLTGPLIKLTQFDPDPDPWFLDLNVEIKNGQIVFPSFDEVVEFELKDSIMKMQGMTLSKKGIAFDGVNMPWLSSWLNLPLKCTSGTLDGFANFDFSKYDLELEKVQGTYHDMSLSADVLSLNDQWEGRVQNTSVTYRGAHLKEFSGSVGKRIAFEGILGDTPLRIVGTKVDKQALVGMKLGEFEGRFEIERDTLKGSIADCLTLSYQNQIGHIEGEGVDQTLYNHLFAFLDLDWKGQGQVDLMAHYAQGKADISVYPKEGMGIDFGSIALCFQEEKPIHCHYEAGQVRAYGSVKRLDCDYKSHDLHFHNIVGNFLLEKDELKMYGLKGNLGTLDLEGEIVLTLNETRDVEINVTKVEGRLHEAATLIPDKMVNRLPLDGDFSGRLTYEEEQGWQGTIFVSKGTYRFLESSGLADVSFNCDFAQEVILTNVCGNLDLRGMDTPRLIPLRADKIVIDEDRAVHFDVRLEAKTHDLFRFAGALTEERLALNCELTHLFGTKFESFDCKLSDWKPAHIELMANVTFHDLLQHIELLNQFGLGVKEDLSSLELSGQGALKLVCSEEGDYLEFDAANCTYERAPFPIYLSLERHDAYIKCKRSQFGEFQMHGDVEKIVDFWEVSNLSVTRGKSALTISEGDLKGDQLSFKFQDAHIHLDDFKVDGGGLVLASGSVNANLHHRSVQAVLDVNAENILKADLNVQAVRPLEIHYSPHEGLIIDHTEFELTHKDLWAKCGFDRVMWQSQVSGKGLFCTLPPEMCVHLAHSSVLPIEMNGDKIVFGGNEFKWENQIDLEAHFVYDHDLTLQGRLKNGYYWIKDAAYPLNDTHFEYQEGRLDIALKTELFKQPIELSGSAQLFPTYQAELSIKDPFGNLLTLTSQKDKPVQSLSGKLFGLDCSFYQGTRGGLSGQIKINFPELMPLLGPEAQAKLEAFGLGAGYEIAGDIVFGATPHFEGFIKGKDFECLGSRLKTFMGHLYADLSRVSIDHLKMSDQAGIIFIKDINIDKVGESWKLKMPSLTVQDFRPSMLKKIGKFRGDLKPLIIRDLSFHNVEGTLGAPESFLGFGEMHFTNTFREEMHLLELPLELIARIGLDPKILIPIKGTIDFEMRKGKIFLTELKNSHSDGKRSKFYLSRSRPSYIDLNGDLDISIKMRQYVILKVTEPFILSIQGSLTKPKFGLR